MRPSASCNGRGRWTKRATPRSATGAAPRPIQPDRRGLTDRTQAENFFQRSVDFLREVRAELRRVAWPNRAETLNSSTVVLVAVVVLTAAIFGLDTGFSKFVLYLFKQ